MYVYFIFIFSNYYTTMSPHLPQPQKVNPGLHKEKKEWRKKARNERDPIHFATMFYRDFDISFRLIEGSVRSNDAFTPNLAKCCRVVSVIHYVDIYFFTFFIIYASCIFLYIFFMYVYFE